MCQNTTKPECSASGDGDQQWTVNDILRQFGPAYLQKYGSQMPPDQFKALRALQRCRQPEAGSVTYYCHGCNRVHHLPKACGNRHCPSCQGDKARHWLAQQQARLLPCAYFMLTFTLPSQLRRFVRSHPQECYRALMVAAYQSMATLAKDRKYLGSSNIGATGVLHTWGRDMNYHPHVHFIVPGGAISQSGDQWLPSRTNYFVCVLALSKLFRAKFKQMMQQCGLLSQIDCAVWQQPWVVSSQAVGDGRQSLRYLAPYVFRVATGNHRIARVEVNADGTGKVTFMVKPSKQPSYRQMTVTAEEFIRRFLQHVLPRGLQKVRHFGFMHKRSKVLHSWLAMLVTVTLNMSYSLIVGAEPTAMKKSAARCPECGGELECLGVGQHAMLRLRLIASLAQLIDSS
jgi:Putative transposase/Transposase zinc-binding domain